MNKITLAIVVTVLILLGILMTIFYVQEKSAVQAINSFVGCAENGYPVMKSYPRQCITPDGRNFVEEIKPTENTTTTIPVTEKIKVTSPKSGQVISSPFLIEGEAMGSWYFEASFPAKLVDANDKEIAVIPVQAKGDWMTNDFVSFKTELKFGKVTTKTGTLILQKDNPSGLPEHDESIKIPIIFATSSILKK